MTERKSLLEVAAVIGTAARAIGSGIAKNPMGALIGGSMVAGMFKKGPKPPRTRDPLDPNNFSGHRIKAKGI